MTYTTVLCPDNNEYEIKGILLKEYQLKGCEQSFAMLSPKGERVVVPLRDLDSFYNKGYILNPEFGSQPIIDADAKVFYSSDFKPAAYALLIGGAVITICIIALGVRLFKKLWVWSGIDVLPKPKSVKQVQKISEIQNTQDRIESLSIDELNDFLSGSSQKLTEWIHNGGEKPIKKQNGGYV